MLQSMTGFGKSEISLNNSTYSIDIKSVNSRNADINIRLPFDMREYELEIKKIIAASLQRGKIDVYINTSNKNVNGDVILNTSLINNYIEQMDSINSELPLQVKFEAAMRMPNIISEEETEWQDDDWARFKNGLEIAIENIIQFRKDEGAILQNEFKNRVAGILELLSQVDQYEEERIVTIKDRMYKALEEIKEVDKERLEQELIFYTEKLDITEEKVRLKNHCDYFLETMSSPDSNGKKLNFITQEMGREINTLGSKANHAELQKIVVEMKDELEKIKEQILNIL